MAIISLRAYNREIEEMIENGQNEEAVAHCRYILEHFPKHVDTYRLMGKALLETQRLGDAADVFQRVLSCTPDDFIAHLGMSIVREDEGDINAALWHMERAFETQPSNAAIQAELRRLYGRREGLSPAKIQLTRGALARMSAKSNLNSQAINELRAALAEDPSRPDLQVLLAKLYAITGQNLEAIETCNTLLKKLPYCLEANRILAELLPGTERSKDAAIYRARYEELDPYAAKISPASPSPDLVPDGAISLDKLEIPESVETALDSGQPGWAASIGVAIDDEEEVPEWLAGITASPGSQMNKTVQDGETPHKEPAGEKDIVDLPGEVQPEDMPDWLKEIQQRTAAPTQESDYEPLPDWLKQTKEGELEGVGEGAEISPVASKGEETESESQDIIEDRPITTDQVFPAEDRPSVLDDVFLIGERKPGVFIQPGEGVDMVPEGETEKESPEESESGAHETESGEQTMPVPGAKPETETPEWLTSGEIGEAVEDEVPEWLQDLGEGLPEELPIVAEPASGSSTIPGAEDEMAEISPGSLPDWLEEVSNEPTDRYTGATPLNAEEIAGLEDEEISKAEVPDWLRQMEEEFLKDVEEPPEEFAEASPLQLTPDEEPFMRGDIPSWLIDAMETEESDILSTSPLGAGPEEIETIQEDTQPVRVSPEKFEPVSGPEYPSEPSTPGYDENYKEGLPAFLEQVETPMEQELSAELPAMSAEDEAAALAWLESLAARQGALEEELLTEPAERTEEIPEWVQQEAEGEGRRAPLEEVLIPDTEAVEEEIALEQVLEEPVEELAELTELEIEAEAETSPAAPIEIGSEWVPEVEEQAEAEAITEPALEGEEELPAWLREIDQEAEVETQPSWSAIETEVEYERPPEFTPAKLDINSASLIQLERIPGVGFILAQNIINYRETEGPFESLSELERVPGFSMDLMHELEEYLSVEIVTAAPPPPSTQPELQGAWEKIASGNIEAAMKEYSELIRQERYLDDVIRDLQEAISLRPVDAILYQTLGDAFVRANRLQEALDAYDRAEDLLK